MNRRNSLSASRIITGSALLGASTGIYAQILNQPEKITGMNPRASPGPIFRRKQRGIIPSDFVGIVRLKKFNSLRS